MEQLSKQEATEFFAKFYNGEHHIPDREPKPFGLGWSVKHNRGDLATFDFNQLTKLVVMGHDKCIRVSVEGVKSSREHAVLICIWKRERDGSMYERHPILEDHIKTIRECI